jgi:hypothetical protein
MKWIKLLEQEPEHNIMVLALTNEAQYCLAYRYPEPERYLMLGNSTPVEISNIQYWAYLPDPPEEVG